MHLQPDPVELSKLFNNNHEPWQVTLLRVFYLMLGALVLVSVTSLMLALAIQKFNCQKIQSPRSHFLKNPNRKGFFKSTYFIDVPYSATFAQSIIRNV